MNKCWPKKKLQFKSRENRRRCPTDRASPGHESASSTDARRPKSVQRAQQDSRLGDHIRENVDAMRTPELHTSQAPSGSTPAVNYSVAGKKKSFQQPSQGAGRNLYSIKKETYHEQLEMAGCDMGGQIRHRSSRDQMLPKKENYNSAAVKIAARAIAPPHLRETIKPPGQKRDGLQRFTSPSQTPGRRPHTRKLGRHENPRAEHQPAPLRLCPCRQLQHRWPKNTSNRRRREPVAIFIQKNKQIATSSWRWQAVKWVVESVGECVVPTGCATDGGIGGRVGGVKGECVVKCSSEGGGSGAELCCNKSWLFGGGRREEATQRQM